MNTFDNEPKCVKCLSKDIFMTWKKEQLKGMFIGSYDYPEHMLCTCRNCHYEWHMKPATKIQEMIYEINNQNEKRDS